MSVWNAYRQGLLAFLPVMITQVILGLAIMGLTILLLIPALYFGPQWALAYTVATLEGVSGWSAMERSRFLVKGHWQLVAVTCALGVGIPVGFYYAINAVLSGLPHLRLYWSWLAATFGLSFFVTQLVVLYHRLRQPMPAYALPAIAPSESRVVEG